MTYSIYIIYIIYIGVLNMTENIYYLKMSKSLYFSLEKEKKSNIPITKYFVASSV